MSLDILLPMLPVYTDPGAPLRGGSYGKGEEMKRYV